MFTHGNITYRYHQETGETNHTEEDYKEWLEELPENIIKEMKTKGFENSKRVLLFTWYVMEQNDIGLEEYIRLHMDAEDYADYKLIVAKS